MKLPNKIIYRPHISEQRRLYFIFASLVVVLPFLFAIISLSAQFSFGQKIPSSIWNIGLQALSAAIGGTLISLFGGYWLAHSLFRVDFRGRIFYSIFLASPWYCLRLLPLWVWWIFSGKKASSISY